MVSQLVFKPCFNNQFAIDCEEEVIAEDYDDPGCKTTSFSNRKLKAPVAGCPSKYSICHDCSDYCQKRFGNGKENPSPTTQRNFQKLTKRYPLFEEWEQIWDAGVATYYFWNTVMDQVSWLPPGYPKAYISMSVNKLRGTAPFNCFLPFDSGATAIYMHFDAGVLETIERCCMS